MWGVFGVLSMTNETKCKHCHKGKQTQFFKEPIPIVVDTKTGKELDSGLCNGMKYSQEIRCVWCCGTGIHTPLSEDPYL